MGDIGDIPNTSVDCRRGTFLRKGEQQLDGRLVTLPLISPGEGGKGGQCGGLTTLPSPCADCIEILGALTFWSP